MGNKIVHVAAAAIRNADRQILIAKRPDDKHQGGLWEFPGGKVEPGEPVVEALQRELHEELGIDVIACRPLIQVPYHYPDKSVFLDVYEVSAFEGEPWGKEGQPVKWASETELESYAFPAANKPILNACLLPDSLAITPFDCSDFSDGSDKKLLGFVEKALLNGAGGVMLRLDGLSNVSSTDTSSSKKDAIGKVRDLCQSTGNFLSVNCSIELANALQLDAVHLTSERLVNIPERSAFYGRWLSASCHNEEQVAMALEKGVDFIFLSPVNITTSHPEARPLGWERYKEIVSQCTVPVYALGGMDLDDLNLAIESGGQGIAAISAWLTV
ncbi:Nudix family hydrolase [Neptuniibacter sp.]|uniref:Nudix family hydrolase n=1 Tax=Neptuniibacter sp. TaxID=1962643 RepID=UPI002628E603|nr:Nudix family hydrolase [Neptuniibacter sp.]MCP4598130.1 Nudix family hydrolase [Neptuniibacter sp.]